MEKLLERIQKEIDDAKKAINHEWSWTQRCNGLLTLEEAQTIIDYIKALEEYLERIKEEFDLSTIDKQSILREKIESLKNKTF